MKMILKAIVICAGICLLASCAEDQAFDNGYYSSSYSPDLNSGNTGYNRNYQQHKNGYSSSQSTPNAPRANPQPQANNGYSTSTTTAQAGYGSNGYSSSASTA